MMLHNSTSSSNRLVDMIISIFHSLTGVVSAAVSSTSEMTYIVSGGALNSTRSLR